MSRILHSSSLLCLNIQKKNCYEDNQTITETKYTLLKKRIGHIILKKIEDVI